MKLKKFLVEIEVSYSGHRIVEAFDEEDAIEQCQGMSADEVEPDFQPLVEPMNVSLYRGSKA